MIDQNMKNKIDNMSYEAMFSLWRHALVGHEMFTGEVGSYFTRIMKEKRTRIKPEAITAMSKRIGW